MAAPPPLAPPPELTLEQAKAAVAEVEELLNSPEVQEKVDALKAQIGDNPDNVMVVMMVAIPQAVEVLKPVLEKYPSEENHFSPDQMGLFQFLAACQKHDDPEIKKIADSLKSKFIPEQMVRSPSGHPVSQTSACRLDSMADVSVVGLVALPWQQPMLGAMLGGGM
eukprot:scaffold1172_cov409-Prasinococcus_capsulatus_cf.AAC.13